MAAEPQLAVALTGTRSSADVRQALQGLLLQRLSQDPNLAGVASLLQSQLTPAPGRSEPAAEKRRPEHAEPSPTVRRLQEAVTVAAAEERRLRGLLAELAAALGACTACLGREPPCDACSGLGGPGFAEPSQEAFARWVEPAMARRLQHEAMGEVPDDVVNPTPQGGSI